VYIRNRLCYLSKSTENTRNSELSPCVFDSSTIDQATREIDQIRAIGRDYVASEPFDFTSHRNEATGETVFRVRVRVPLPASRVVPLIGNCVHNMRSTLNHLVSALAERQSAQLRHPERTDFPIFRRRADYHAPKRKGVSNGEWALQEVAPEAREVIEALQPFQVDEPDDHPLWMLHELSNVNKHRRPLAAGAVATSAGYTITRMQGVEFRGVGTSLTGPFEDGAIVARFHATFHTPDAILSVRPNLSTDFAFSKAGPVGGRPVVETLEEIRDCVRDGVLPALTPFL
jgi:hypothetical protein